VGLGRVVDLIVTFLAMVPFYLLGCFPTGILLARFVYGVDITKIGSGNVGATNVARGLGKRAGVITLLIDLAKGALAVFLAKTISVEPWYQCSAAVAVVCGHCYSIPRYLRGGKGVATGLGVLCALLPASALVSLCVFASVFSLTRFVSLASVLATLVAPIYSLVTGQLEQISLSLVFISGVIVYRHRENLKRLVEGREPRFGTGQG
jgi:glycerol-3-phosphate acyltransferase PlsY